MRSPEKIAPAVEGPGKTPLSQTPAGPGEEVPTGARSARLMKLARYLVMPVVLALVCLGLYLYVGSLTLDSIEQRSLNANVIVDRTVQHLRITAVATVVVVVLAIGAGILLTRPAMRKVAPYIIAVASTGQAMPSIGVIVLIAVLFNQVGFRVAVIALVISAFLPILRNTMVGINQVDRSVIEAGRGMGMTRRAVLWKIELPLAVPIMLAGIRTALIIVVGTAALATFINAGGLGDIINTGIKTARDPILITGAVLTAVLALAVDYVAGIAEDVLRPKGL
ncbi:ABC-type proline/glycine betaine transport systems permease component [Rubrobacter radiotolerans]|uniref:ABC transporter permease n=1 Tax=Rubrobacter radiotolerans TaxID=42256 RepID=A0A023X5T0_RUBRA|nr:ABC transporter permease [Rubrobacter radiotolerans]AHY47360.1 ABC-type proline/glycine betaine transport systems permease component [Rubrobacter radiotolerans]MDX5894764.1 ABC transporter permease [Rubrobacter radiotolerans]SMC06720.1 osmoprotectant transport system permease protein [Rubrobacter radiotolerans DSM 5868]